MKSFVLLPGSYCEAADFERQGFQDAARREALDGEVFAVECRATWFADGSALDRIRATAVEPARARGSTEIWLCGISLGALAALAYAARRSRDLAGLLLLSPYPGTRDTLDEIEAQGGIEHWTPRIPAEGDLEREAWAWLQGRPSLPVHCYFGRDDRFAAGQRRIGTLLDAKRVHEMPGGHDWAMWRAGWDAFLAAMRPVAA